MDAIVESANRVVDSQAIKLFKTEFFLKTGISLEKTRLYFYPRWADIWCLEKYLARNLRKNCWALATQCSRWDLELLRVYLHKGDRFFTIPKHWSNEAFEKNFTGINNMNSPIVVTPSLQVDSLQLSRPLLDVFGHFLENPDIRGGLVRVADERQLVLTSSPADMMKDETLEEATKLKREDYWYLPDLHEFRQAQRTLEPDNPSSSLEFRYRVVMKDEITWNLVVTRYRLVTDNLGNLYQVTQNLAFEDIPAPPPINSI